MRSVKYFPVFAFIYFVSMKILVNMYALFSLEISLNVSQCIAIVHHILN